MSRLLSILPLLPTLLTGQEQNPQLIAQLQETISKTVDTQTLESKERLHWQARKEELATLLQLHRQELALLDEELAKSGQSAPSHATSLTTLKDQLTPLKNARRLTSTTLAQNLPRTLTLAKHLPPPLLTEIEPELTTLHTSKPSDDPRETLRSILTLLAKAEQFNRRFTRHTEIHENREVQVLYLGLGRAFYAGSGTTAGIGKPTPDGWHWQPRPDLHTPITQALATMDKSLPPAMISLPMEID